MIQVTNNDNSVMFFNFFELISKDSVLIYSNYNKSSAMGINIPRKDNHKSNRSLECMLNLSFFFQKDIYGNSDIMI